MINQEEAPFHFKIHLFHGGPKVEGEPPVVDHREVKTKIMNFLQSFAAENIDSKPILDRTGRGNDKLRVLFEINDKDRAAALYDMVGVHKQNHLPESDQKMQIYFLLAEDKFETYADEAAKMYYAEEARRKEQRDAQWKEEKEHREQEKGQFGNRRQGGDNYNRDGNRGPNKGGRRNHRDHLEA